MSHEHFAKEGKRIRVTSYGPFRGLKGTIVRVNIIDGEEDDPFFGFYLIALDSLREPMWFEHNEIEFIDALLFVE
ncbi:hypothetical protein KSD_56030 [Ktedonobacter sp. SOSP1-85]|uniref:KOW motif-containing protein n=1 Tax=unclassified Ktedonobacter TaxID=388461 RepID=UPI001915B619|nr:MULTISPECIES: KOW motif-containing protein [unclassified Ktedonobacter]GHO68090.1 hypothetical protein KSC_069820 [Ktedonobacter sp. SOSP1-52]GHO77832.1 hypothetical protein KSD_56030 [Ktedonobacter sp. SOSP1-85]